MDEHNEISLLAIDIDKIRDKSLGTAGALKDGFGMWYAKNLYEIGYRNMNYLENKETEYVYVRNGDYEVIKRAFELICRDMATVMKKSGETPWETVDENKYNLYDLYYALATNEILEV